MRPGRWLGVVLILWASAARAQSVPPPDSVTVVPGPHYAKGGVHRFLFGAHYRDLWTTPVRVPVLDLTRFAGGLRPVRRGGGQQTKTLRLEGADGRQYQFRSVDKDPTAVLPPGLRETLADRILQDQISAGHPAGALVVPPILEAAGVLNTRPLLVMMPDDSRLGEFRAEFAGVLGTIEERPDEADDGGAAFAGAVEVVGSDKLLDRLEEDPAVRVDAAAFLAARLTDVFLGDWDRHRDQWRWALVDDAHGRRWLPIPRDRDQAFVRFDGFLFGLIRQRVPQLVAFGPEYPPIVGATWNGRDLDRQLLSELERPVWDSVARTLQAQITDEVIDSAVGRLPPEFQRRDGPRLRAGLRARRDGLPAMARRYYALLAGDVDVFATDQSELARAERLAGDTLEVTVAVPGQAPWFRRRFSRAETEEVRLHLQGGDDRAVVAGSGRSGIIVRVLGGGGDDAFADSARHGSARFYDSRGRNSSWGRGIDARPYQAIDDTTDPTALAHRDWGRTALSFPMAAIGPDAGLQLGWGGRFTWYGFRKKPWATRLRYGVTAATGAGTGRIAITARWMRENSRSFWSVGALASGVEVLRWHGFGNDQPIDPSRPTSYYQANQHQIALDPSFGWALGERTRLTFGPRFKYSVTELDDGPNADRYIGSNRPFGASAFAELGVGAELEMDTRDLPAYARRGVRLQLGARYVPNALDVTASFATVRGEVATYLSPSGPAEPVLALLAGGEALFGTAGQIPFHEAAYLGSATTLRGFRSHRFAGDRGSLYGSAELRLALTRLFLLVPGRQGLFGFYDAGRVYQSGEASDTWHTSFGGGVWLSFVTPGSVIRFAIARSDEGTRLHAGVGMGF